MVNGDQLVPFLGCRMVKFSSAQLDFPLEPLFKVVYP